MQKTVFTSNGKALQLTGGCAWNMWLYTGIFAKFFDRRYAQKSFAHFTTPVDRFNVETVFNCEDV